MSLLITCALVFLLSISLFITGYLYINENKVEKSAPVVIYDFRVKPTVRALLDQGVVNAWETNFTKDIKADCFTTRVLDDQISIFSYCKLKRPIGISEQ